MEKLHFEIIINAPVEKVWDKMLSQESYKQWTALFDPSSTYIGSWDKGSEIKFTGGDGGGMLAKIEENILHKFVSIKQLGELNKEGVLDTSKATWENAFENYTFSDVDGKTKLEIDLTGLPKEMIPMFEGMWPNALNKLKEMCEVQSTQAVENKEEPKDCDYKCESCFMPLGKNLEDAGTETDGSKSIKYCKYCYQNGKLMYEGDLKTFQKIAYEQMLHDGMWKPKAWLFTKMIAYAPRWKK